LKKIVYLEDIINEWINNKKTLKLQSLLNYKMLINRYINKNDRKIFAKLY